MYVPVFFVFSPLIWVEGEMAFLDCLFFFNYVGPVWSATSTAIGRFVTIIVVAVCHEIGTGAFSSS